MSTAFIFPGQGTQYVGMGRDFYERFAASRAVFDRADSILGFRVSEMCFDGPADELNSLDNQQTAIFVTSVAILEALKTTGRYKKMIPSYAAGLSLGEYTAYCAAGSMSFDSGLKVLAGRKEFMREASENGDGTMVAIFGLGDSIVLDLCSQARNGDVLEPANFNCPGQVVVSGHRSACLRVMELAQKAGALKIIPLDVNGAFHCPLMQPAADKLKRILDQTEFLTPKIPVIANLDSGFNRNPNDIRESLYRQMTSGIRWSQSMTTLIDLGVDHFVEIGPKHTLTNFMKRIDPSVRTTTISEVGDLEESLPMMVNVKV